MTNNNILIVDDEIMNTKLLKEFLEIRGMNPTACQNGKEALDAFRKEQFPIVVTDIEMPVMDGIELIENIKSLNSDTVILILSAHSDSSIIVKTMQLGAYDYIVKPVDYDDVYLKLQRARESVELRRNERIIKKEKQIRLENQLEWFRWQERILSRDIDVNDSSLFSGLKRSFTQGNGFGALLSILDIVKMNAVRNSDGMYMIDSNIMSLVTDNMSFAKKGLDAFSEIEYLEKNELDMKNFSVEEIYNMIKHIIETKSDITKIKNHEIHLSSIKKSFSYRSTSVNEEYFSKAISEILLNSVKFSQRSTSIHAIIDIADEKLIINILNTPLKNEMSVTGISEGYENLVFEPFFRMTRFLYEEYKTLDFGVGLTMCEKIIIKHRGSIKLFNVTDHSDIKAGPQLKVCCEIQLPLESF